MWRDCKIGKAVSSDRPAIERPCLCPWVPRASLRDEFGRCPVTPDQPNPCGTYVAREQSENIEYHEYLQFRRNSRALWHDTS